jgi:ABC-2 type transport system permease protein
MEQAKSSRMAPGDIAQIGTITKYELLNYRRSRRFFVLLALVVLVGVLLTLVLRYSNFQSGLPIPSLGFYATIYGTFVSYIVILSGIFFGGDSISSEFHNKTGYFLMGNPIKRSSIYLGKLSAAFLASLGILGVYVAFSLANGLYYVGIAVPVQLGESVLFSVLYLGAVLGVAFFFSSLFRSNSFAILVSVILLLFVFSVIQIVVEGLEQMEPWYVLTYGAGIITDVFQVPYPPHNQLGSGYVVTIPEGLAIMGAYFIASVILGMLIFRKKEFL